MSSSGRPVTAQSGSGAILPWATGTVYIQGQPVTNSGSTYTANDAHTAGATFAGDLASHWTLLPVAATVDITAVGFDLILLLGQSNMVGRGTVDTNYDVSDPRVWAWGATGTYAGKIALAGNALFFNGGQASGIGPAGEFARWYAQAYPSRKVLLIPAARDGSGFTEADAQQSWTPDYAGAGGQNLFLAAVAQTQAALAAAGPNARIAAMLWLQGEGANTQTLTYAASLDELIGALRDELGADIPFIAGEIPPESNGASLGGITEITYDTPRRVLRTGFAYGPGPGFTGDDLGHYNATGQRILGRNFFFNGLRVALGNTLGAPVTPPSVTATQSGTSLNVAWLAPAAHTTDYLIRYRVVGAGSWTTLTRAQSIDIHATITGITPGSTYEVGVASVNAAGTSAYTVATVATFALPSKVTGLSAGTATGSTQPLSWSAATAATSYLVEYKAHSSGTWLTAATGVTGTSYTVSGLAAATSYDYRVSGVNAAGTGTASDTLTASTAAGGTAFLTAVGVTAGAAYGLRLLKSGYAGKAIRVRRSSDNTELDIGFVGEALDTAALLTFAGAGSAFVKTWYDQSGNTRDITQATTGAQPRIVLAGVLDTLNGLPTMRFDGTDDILKRANIGIYADGAASLTGVLQSDSDSGTGWILEESTAASDNGFWSVYGGELGSQFLFKSVNDAGSTLVFTSQPTLNIRDALRQVTAIDTGTALVMRINGTGGSASYSRTGSVTPDTFAIGGANRGGYVGFFKGGISEMTVFLSALDSTARGAAETNETTYYSIS